MTTTRREVLALGSFSAIATLASCARLAPHPSDPAPQPSKPMISSRPLFTLFLTTAPTQSLGKTPAGTRVIFPIAGGTFEGERLRGTVLPGGADWTVVRNDGVMELDLRITLQTDDGALVHMTFFGLRDDAAPGQPYFRTLPRFETSAPKYAFLNRLLAVGTGEVRGGQPVHVIDEVL